MRDFDVTKLNIKPKFPRVSAIFGSPMSRPTNGLLAEFSTPEENIAKDRAKSRQLLENCPHIRLEDYCMEYIDWGTISRHALYIDKYLLRFVFADRPDIDVSTLITHGKVITDLRAYFQPFKSSEPHLGPIIYNHMVNGILMTGPRWLVHEKLLRPLQPPNLFATRSYKDVWKWELELPIVDAIDQVLFLLAKVSPKQLNTGRDFNLCTMTARQKLGAIRRRIEEQERIAQSNNTASAFKKNSFFAIKDSYFLKQPACFGCPLPNDIGPNKNK